jgi:Ca2+-binding RTX toxin-like protein
MTMLITLILLSAVNAVAAGNVVPPTRLDDDRIAITIGDFTPAACAAIPGLTNIITGSGWLIFGTAGNDLIFADSAVNWIFAADGNDCIVGGGSDDWIVGGPGTDVCIGGPGTDTFNQCEPGIQ